MILTTIYRTSCYCCFLLILYIFSSLTYDFQDYFIFMYKRGFPGNWINYYYFCYVEYTVIKIENFSFLFQLKDNKRHRCVFILVWGCFPLTRMSDIYILGMPIFGAQRRSIKALRQPRRWRDPCPYKITKNTGNFDARRQSFRKLTIWNMAAACADFAL